METGVKTQGYEWWWMSVMRNFLIVTGLSAMAFLGIMGKTIDINFWSRLLYNKEYSPEQKKKSFKIGIVIWAITTIILFVFAFMFAVE